MIAIDTNVLLRYLLGDDKTQFAKASKLISSNYKVLVTDIVLAETIWTLKGKKYKLSKQEILMVIDSLFKEPNIIFEDGETVWRSVNDYRVAKPVKTGSKKKELDFPDALILEKSKYVVSKKEENFEGLYTFDVAAQQLDEVKIP